MPCVHAKSLSSCPTLCDKMDCSPCPGSSIYGILQVRILESVVILFCRGSSQPGIEPGSVTSTCTGRGFFTTSATWKAQNKTVFIKNLKKHQELAALFPPKFGAPHSFGYPHQSQEHAYGAWLQRPWWKCKVQ